MQSIEYSDLPFVQSRWYTSGRSHAVQLAVVHHTAGSEGVRSAEDGAGYDSRRAEKVSCHYFHDQDSTVQTNYTWNTAWSAYSEGNARGVHHELCGGQQTRAQWLDAASDGTLTQAARQIARDCKKYDLPVRRLTIAQMRVGEKGICGHGDVTQAWGQGDHMDPGPYFPWDVLLARVEQFLNPAPTTPQQEDDMNSLVYVRRGAPEGQPQLWALAGAAAAPGGWVETDSEYEATEWAIRFGGPHQNSIDVPYAKWPKRRAEHTGVSA